MTDEAPPKGRVHFLATVGVAIAPLFFFIIVMSGVGVAVLGNRGDADVNATAPNKEIIA